MILNFYLHKIYLLRAQKSNYNDLNKVVQLADAERPASIRNINTYISNLTQYDALFEAFSGKKI